MKKFFVTLCLFMVSSLAMSQTLWMRRPAISPNGEKIVFTYKGDLYLVPTVGGEAKQLTTTDSYESNPVWSPDSETIAFTSDRFANTDIFIMSANGGEAIRLTTNSYAEIPYSFTADGKSVLFTSSRNSLASDVRFPSGTYTRTYKISIKGGREELVTAAPSSEVKISKDGKSLIYSNIKGGENIWRKHHTSSVARDIILCDLNKDTHTVLTTNIGEDRNPVFSKDNKTVYYLSEPEGKTFNVYSMPLDNPSEVSKVSNFDTHPVRFLSISNDDLLCYSYMGEIYTQEVGSKAKKVKVNINNDRTLEVIRDVKMNGTIDSHAVSPDGKQVAFTIRGEVYVTSVDYGITKRITNTPQAESGLTFLADGRSLLYGSDRDGTWNIYKATITREEDICFATATLISEEPFFKASKTEKTQPRLSPNGEELAFVQDRNKLMVYNLKSKKTRMVTNGDYHYVNTLSSYYFDWSPNSKWFAISYVANTRNPYYDIGIVSAEGGKIYNLTESGYMNSNPKWTADGTAVLFTTDRYGMRSHASWGSLNDIMIAHVNQDAYDKFRLTDKEYDLMKAEDARILKLKNKAEEAANGKKKETKAQPKDTVGIVMELNNIKDRVTRLTSSSGNVGSYITTKDASSVLYVLNNGLYSMNLRTRKSSSVSGGARGSMIMNADATNIFIIGGNSIHKLASTGSGSTTSVPFNAVMALNSAGEREYMFNHVYTQELKRFYVEDLHGVDWKGMKEAYEPQLAHINNNYDFAELLSEMLGELNVSHTGGRFSPSFNISYSTAELGVFFDETYKGDGLKVEEIIAGSPFDKAKSAIKKGDTITSIDGVDIKAGMDYYSLLANKVGVRMLIGYSSDDKTKHFEVIKPISKSALSDLLYDRWIKWQAKEVERLSGGRLGYVHIKSMDDESFRKVYSDVLGKYNNYEAIVIDTRNNGGGRLHEDIEAFFTGTKYLTQMIRGRETCDMPSRRWNKPSIMLMNEANYSNAHGTPWVYKNREIGKLVGTPVPGTMTSVTWERLQDNSLVFGIPQVGYLTVDGEYLENKQLEPDFKVENDPSIITKSRDQQLEKAVSELLKELDADKK